uniref:Uncharacterized protein n=1 Tax=Leptobrachium leishanense TaxID=445787 RepID=A0A8C5MPP0_9ANUR
SVSSAVPEHAQADEVDEQPPGAHPYHHQRLLDGLRLGEALDGLQHDGEAEGGEEDGVNQGPHHPGPDPAERVLVGGVGLLGEAHGDQAHQQRDDVGQHVEGVGEHGQRARHPAHHHLHHEEDEANIKSNFCTRNRLFHTERAEGAERARHAQRGGLPLAARRRRGSSDWLSRGAVR